MMEPARQNKPAASLAQRFSREAVLAIALLSAASFVVFALVMAGFQQGNKQEARTNLLDLMSSSITAAVWHYDVRAIDDIVEAYQKNTEVEYALVRDQYGSVLSDSPVLNRNKAPDIMVPIDSEFGGVAGQLEVWWKVPNGGVLSENFLAFIGALILFGMVTLFSTLFINIALNRHIVRPLEQLRAHLLDPAQDERIATTKNLENTREFILFRNAFNDMHKRLSEERRLRNDALSQKKQALAKNERATNALSAVFSTVRQTIIIVDQSGELVASRISAPFQERHISQFLAAAHDAVDAQDIFEEMGGRNFRRVDHVSGEIAIEFTMPNGRLLSAVRVKKDGNFALVLTDITSQTTTESALDEILKHSHTGIVIFSSDLAFQYERGAGLDRLNLHLTSGERDINDLNILENTELSDCLNTPGSEQSLHVDSKDYFIKSVRLRSGQICLVHTDVTHIRQIEREMQQGRNLRVVGQLTSGIAHDFNNILGAILGNLELMLGNDEEDFSKTVEEAIYAAKRGVSTIKHLLAYSRNQPLAPEITDFDAILNESLALFKTAAGSDVEVLLETHTNAYILVDQSMLVSAIMNIVVNARDAMDRRGKISLSTAVQQGIDGKPDQVVLKLRDTGPGVPKHLEAGIFDPFITTKAAGTGTGLGLAMVKGFIEKSGGTVSYQNLARGAEFSLFFKMENVLPDNDSIVNFKPRAIPTFPKNQGVDRKLRVVLLDDEQALLRSTALILEKLNYEVTPFCDPKMAQNWFEQGNAVDIFMTDFAMPEINGLQFIRQNLKALKGAALVLCSGNVDDEMISEAKNLAEITILEKPFTVNNLSRKFNEIVLNG